MVRYNVHETSSGTCVALDEMQENINKYTKEMVLKGDESTWLKHSPNVVVGRRSIAFSDSQYHRRYLHYDDLDQQIEVTDRRSYKTHGIAPRLEREREIIYEFFVKFFSEEISDRKYDQKEALILASRLKTKIKKLEYTPIWIV